MRWHRGYPVVTQQAYTELHFMRFHHTLHFVLVIVCGMSARASEPIQLPNGFAITPDATPHSVQLMLNPGVASYPNFTLGQAVTTALNPDGTQLLVLTSGYNRGPGQLSDFAEYVFVYDVTSSVPRQVQALPIPNSFCGLAWNPSGQEFYVSGGVDDSVYVFARRGLGYSRAASIGLGHPHGNGLLSGAPAPGNSFAPKPMTAGIAVNRSGTAAVVANFYNDSISVIDLKGRAKTARPGRTCASRRTPPWSTRPRSRPPPACRTGPCTRPARARWPR